MHRVEILRHARQGPFQAWMTDDASVSLRRTATGTWEAYLDGVRVADQESDAADGLRTVSRAPLQGRDPYEIADQLAMQRQVHVVFDVL